MPVRCGFIIDPPYTLVLLFKYNTLGMSVNYILHQHDFHAKLAKINAMPLRCIGNICDIRRQKYKVLRC